MRILMAGALGEVGRTVSRALAEDGHEVVRVSSRPQGPGVDVIGLEESVGLVADGRVHLVVNAAGRGDRRPVDRSGTDSGEMLAPAVAATATPSVLLSTMRVLEGYPAGVAEDARPKPETSYADANARNEDLWLSEAGPTASVLRIANFFCAPAGVESPQARLLPWSLVTEGARTGFITVRSRPQTTREFVSAGDVARALEVLSADRPAGRVSSTAPGWLASLEDLVGATQQAFASLGLAVPVATFGDEGRAAPKSPPGWLESRGWSSSLDANEVVHVIAEWLRSHRLD